MDLTACSVEAEEHPVFHRGCQEESVPFGYGQGLRNSRLCMRWRPLCGPGNRPYDTDVTAFTEIRDTLDELLHSCIIKGDVVTPDLFRPSTRPRIKRDGREDWFVAMVVRCAVPPPNLRPHRGGGIS